MSVQALSWMLHHSRSKGNDRNVLTVICNRVNDEGTGCYYKLETIAKQANVSVSTARRAVRNLAELGEIEVFDRPGWTADIHVRLPDEWIIQSRTTKRPKPRGVTRETPADRRDRATNPGRAVPRDSTTGVGRAAGMTGVSDPRDRGVSSDTRYEVETKLSPQPPQSGGAIRRPHCPEHRRWRASCPACQAAANPPKPKPPWCGKCNETTRLQENNGPVYRCPDCHPLTNPTA